MSLIAFADQFFTPAAARRDRLRAYPCQDCHQWHLTHQPNPRRPTPLDPAAAAKRLHRQRLIGWEAA